MTEINDCAVRDCENAPALHHPLPLCRRHGLQVSAHMTDVLHATALHGEPIPSVEPSGIEAADVAHPNVWNHASHKPLVYFISNGDRVKIGVSTNIAARVGALSLRRSNALLLLWGSYSLEKALHQHFAADQVGNTEWFVLSNSIRDFIARRRSAVAAQTVPKAPSRSTLEANEAARRPVQRGRHPRREEITAKVQDARVGISVAELRQWLARRYPNETPPSDTAIQNWFAAHPNISKPSRGLYAWTDTPAD